MGLGNGICDTLLAWSKAFRNSPKLSSRDSISFLEMLTSSLRMNRCCNFESQKWKTSNAKDFLLDPLLTRTIRLWDCEMFKNVVKKVTIYVCFVQKFFCFSSYTEKSLHKLEIFFLVDIDWLLKRTVCKMKSKSGADFSRISVSITFVQSDFCICLINCDTVAVKSFLLVITRTL